jgi:hypothetical protein
MSTRNIIRIIAVASLALVLAACATVPRPAPATPAGQILPDRVDTLVLTGIREATAGEYFSAPGGEARSSLSYDLRQARTFTYVEPTGGRSLRAEILLFGSPLEAWGFARQAAASGPGTARAVRSRDTRVLILSPGLPASLDLATITRMADKLAALLPGPPGPPREVTILEGMGAPPGSVSFEPTVLLDSRALVPAVTAEVPLAPSPRVRVFITARATPAEAAEAYQAFLNERSSGSSGIAFTLGVGESACTMHDGSGGWIEVAKTGRYLVGLAGLTDAGSGWPVISRLAASLGE